MNFLQMKTTSTLLGCTTCHLKCFYVLVAAMLTIVPQFSILALSISIKNTPYKMLATNNIENIILHLINS